MLIIIPLMSLFIFYKMGGFQKLLECFILEEVGADLTPPPPESIKRAETIEEDEEDEDTGADIEVTPKPETAAQTIEPYNPPPIDEEREKLENTAAGMLTACGCKFNVYWYCHELTNKELMDIIKDFNLNK